MPPESGAAPWPKRLWLIVSWWRLQRQSRDSPIKRHSTSGTIRCKVPGLESLGEPSISYTQCSITRTPCACRFLTKAAPGLSGRTRSACRFLEWAQYSKMAASGSGIWQTQWRASCPLWRQSLFLSNLGLEPFGWYSNRGTSAIMPVFLNRLRYCQHHARGKVEVQRCHQGGVL